MQTSNSLWMRAPAERIYALAAEVERWPELLPHYRWVTVLERDGNRKLVEMAARRDWIPVRWQGLQELDGRIPRSRFRHVRGGTKSMEVQRRVERKEGGTLVTIHRARDLRWPRIGQWAAEMVIGPQFVAHIAGKTLRHIKQLAESPLPLGEG